jgi:hypothetical protein
MSGDKKLVTGDHDAHRANQPQGQRGVHRRSRGRVFANRAGGSLRNKDLRTGGSRHGTERHGRDQARKKKPCIQDLLSKSKGEVISAVDPLLCLTPERLGTFGLTESLRNRLANVKNFHSFNNGVGPILLS